MLKQMEQHTCIRIPGGTSTREAILQQGDYAKKTLRWYLITGKESANISLALRLMKNNPCIIAAIQKKCWFLRCIPGGKSRKFGITSLFTNCLSLFCKTRSLIDSEQF